MKILILTFSLVVMVVHSSAQITSAWTGKNGNIVANNAVGGVSFHKFKNANITTQGGMTSIVQSGSVGINGFETLSFSVYPNPTSGLVYLNFHDNLPIRIYNLLGVLILETNVKEIDLSHLSSGTYIVYVPGHSSSKIVKY